MEELMRICGGLDGARGVVGVEAQNKSKKDAARRSRLACDRQTLITFAVAPLQEFIM